MTLAEAQSAAGTFRECLLDNGVRKVSIELQQGVAGSGWYLGTFKRGMGHHIASRPSQGLTPGLATVKNGRGGANPLTGPLANCYGGYDLTARIITLGWANHPGTGGPWSVPGWGTVPRDNGRPYIIGWEFEGGFEPYTDEMHDFMARCGAGTLDFLGTLPGNVGPVPVDCWDEHKGWAGPRKPDRIGYTTASGRARIAAVRGTSSSRTPVPLPVGDDMRTIIDNTNTIWVVTDFTIRNAGTAEDASYVDKTWDHPRKLYSQGEVGIIRRNIDRNRAALGLGPVADVDEDALGKVVLAGLLPQIVQALSEKVPADGGDSLTRDDVVEAVKAVFADAGA